MASEEKRRMIERVVVHVLWCSKCHGLATNPDGVELAPCPCGGDREYIGATGLNRVVEVECVPVEPAEVPHA